MKRPDVRDLINKIGIVPSVRVNTQEMARYAAETIYAAGIPIIEITLTTPGALNLIEEFAARYPDFAIGAGTVLDDETAQKAADAGARFITSPGFVPETVAAANRNDIVVFPGALTPTEVIAAWKAGADFVKIFPAAPLSGAAYVRSLKAPLPQVPLIVTGGVNQLNVTDYIVAGASAIGVGGELFPIEALHYRQEHRIQELARRFLLMVKDGRSMREAYF